MSMSDRRARGNTQKGHANVYCKKKAFKAHCRAQVKAGLINHADGSWRPAGGGTMDQSMRAGYRLN